MKFHVNRRAAMGMTVVMLFAVTHGAASANAPAWPARPIKLIVAGAPGSGMDIFARMLQAPLQAALKQPVIIDNKVGANSLIGNDAVAKAAPDGYTFLFTPSSGIVLNPIIQAKMPYDTQKDLIPVAQVGQSGFLLVTNPSAGLNSLQDVIKYAKANPGKLVYGSWGSGSSGHLAMEGIKEHLGLDMPHVPYKGTASLSNDLMGNNISVGFTDVASPVPHVKAGKLKAIGITGSRRGPALPDVPTLTERGYKFDVDGWYGIFAPKGTPLEIVQRLNTEVNRIMSTEDTHQRFAAQNMLVPSSKSTEQFASTVNSDLQIWQELAKAVNLKLD